MSKYRSKDIQQHIREEQRRNKPSPPVDEEQIKKRRELKGELRRLVRGMTWDEFEQEVVMGKLGAMPGTPEYAELHSLYLEYYRQHL
jgi:hypothetical protein